MRIKTNSVFGKLTVQREYGRSSRGDIVYLCQCSCGRTSKPTATNLRMGNSKSCGTCSKYKYVRADSALKRMFRVYGKNAAKRGLCFDISFEFFKSLVSKPCHYCGATPTVNSYSESAKIPVAVNGVDRVETHAGYTIANTVPCCKICNNAKWVLPVEVFMSWARAVVAVDNLRRALVGGFLTANKGEV